MSYMGLLRKHPKFLAYGGLHYFYSGLGQTFLISVFVPFFLEEFSLERGEFSNCYAFSTVCSAMLLPFAGKKVDQSSLWALSLIGGAGLLLASLAMSFAPSVPFFVLGMFLLRFFGQGGMVLIASTAVGRFFGRDRGKALGMASLGLSVAESLLPAVLILTIGQVGWRMAWMILGACVLFVFLPFARVLLGKNFLEYQNPPGNFRASGDDNKRDSVRDPRFYLLLLAFMFLPFYITGTFIHQGLLAKSQGWTAEWIAFSFVAYGTSKIIASFIGGGLIDRFSARKVFVFFLLPLVLGLSLLLAGNHPVVALLYLALLGATTGLGLLAGTAIWAELYGIKNLGAIKSRVTTCMVVATAVGPLVIGRGFGISVQATLLLCVLVILLITMSNFFVLRPTFDK